jgi:hypothetical protein
MENRPLPGKAIMASVCRLSVCLSSPFRNRVLAIFAAGVVVFAFRLELPNAAGADERYNETLVPTVTPPKYGELPPVPGSVNGQQAPKSTSDENSGLPAPLLSPPPPAAGSPSLSLLDPAAAVSPVYLSVFGGGSYFESSAQTSLGGLYGANLGIPVFQRSALMATGFVNNYTGGTQFASALGGAKFATYYGDTWDRISGGIFYDQYTDTKLGSTYLAQMRYQAGYQVLPYMNVGAVFMDPVVSGSVGTIFPGFNLPLRPFRVVQGQINIGQSTFGIGYVDQENSMTYSYLRTCRITRNVSGRFNASYDERIGLWTGFVGVEVILTPRRSRWGSGLAMASQPRDTVRGEVSLISSALSFPDLLGITPEDNLGDSDEQQWMKDYASIQAILQMQDARTTNAGSKPLPPTFTP